MKRKVSVLLAVIMVMVGVIASFSVSAFAAGYNSKTKDLYIKINGIEGESRDSKHDKWIEVLDFSHGALVPVTEGKGEIAGRGVFENFVFRHKVDKATPRLQEACMKGSHIKDAEFQFCCEIGGKQEVAYKVVLQGIKIVAAHVETEELEDGDFRVVERVEIEADKMTWTETCIGLDNVLGGNTEASYDQTKKATIFDGSTNIVVVILGAAVFILAVVVVILIVGRKKKVALASPNSPSTELDEDDGD